MRTYFLFKETLKVLNKQVVASIVFGFVSLSSFSLYADPSACRSSLNAALIVDLKTMQQQFGQEITFDQLYGSQNLKQKIIDYYKSLGPGKKIVIFTGGTSLDSTPSETSLFNLNRPIRKQNSGVITVMKVMAEEIEKLTGVKVQFITPESFNVHYQIKYQDVIVAMPRKSELKAIINDPDNLAVHLMVEDSVGMAAKKVLEGENLPFTTAYHTDFPTYVEGFAEFYLGGLGKFFTSGNSLNRKITKSLTYKSLRDFHDGSSSIMVPTKTMAQKLIDEGFPKDKIGFWSHGVDTHLFIPSLRDPALYERELNIKLDGRPVALFVGRISTEKNLHDFLDAQLEVEQEVDGKVIKKPAVKVLIGSGPDLEQLKANYPDAYFLGRKDHDRDLPTYMASADVFVFPSITETFGLVGLEAQAGGTPALTYQVQGMQDWNTDTKAGVMVPYSTNHEENMQQMALGFKKALQLNRHDVRAWAERNPWELSILQFLYFLQPLDLKEVNHP